MRKSLVMMIAATMGLPIAAVAQQSANEQDGFQRNQPQTQQQRDVPPAERREANYRGSQDQSNPSTQVSAELVNYLAAKMMLANQCEIEAASMAAERAENPEVKDLANKLQQSHQQLNQQLKQTMPGVKSVKGPSFASNDSSTPAGGERLGNPVDRFNSPTDRNAPEPGGQFGADVNTRNQVAPARDNQGASRQGKFLDGGAQQLIDIHRRAVEINHQMVKRELSEKQGQEFDRCFVNQQIGAHMWMLSELKAIQDVGPSQFTSLVQQTEQEVESHLDAAKQIAKTLEQQNAQAAGQSPSRTRVTE